MRANGMFLGLAAVAVAVSTAGAQRVDRARVNEYGRRTQDGPALQVWIDRYSYNSGERIRAFFQTEPGSYVTVLRVTSRGDIKVLYPHTPKVQRAYTSNQLVDDEIPFATDAGMYVNEPRGVGFVFAIASYTPFNYKWVTSAGRWSTVQLAANRNEDPFTIVSRFVSRTLPRAADYSVDYIEYSVTGADYRFNRPYANSATYNGLSYDDLYFQCLQYYGPRALAYCQSYGRFGGAPYAFGIGRYPTSTPAPVGGSGSGVTPPKMHPPKAFIPDPMVADEGLKPRTPQTDPTGNEVTVFRNPPRDIGRGSGDGNRETGRRAEPVDISPTDYRVDRPAREPQYQPAPQRYEPAPQRYEPAPQSSAPVGAMPRYEPPVTRSEPREMPAPAPSPPPAPPPSPPSSPSPAPSSAPTPSPVPIIPPGSPPAVDR